MAASDPHEAFREALAHSPDNVPLRRLLADSLLAHGLADEAEVEYRRGLVLAPTDANLQLGLVRAFLRQEKSSAALALIEAMVKRPDGPAEVFVIHARLLAARGEIPAAIAQYRLGIESDPTAADALAITHSLRVEGNLEARRLAEQIEQACRAAH